MLLIRTVDIFQFQSWEAQQEAVVFVTVGQTTKFQKGKKCWGMCPSIQVLLASVAQSLSKGEAPLVSSIFLAPVTESFLVSLPRWHMAFIS